MKKRQLKKILDTYLVDEDGVTLVPPSIYREDDRATEKFFQKAWQISHPEEAKEIQAAMEKAYAEAAEHCSCGCHHDHADGECCCHEDHKDGECKCNGEHKDGECCCEDKKEEKKAPAKKPAAKKAE